MGCDFSDAQIPQTLQHQLKFASIFEYPLRFKRQRPKCIIPYDLKEEDANLLMGIIQTDEVKLFATQLQKKKIPLGIQTSEPGLFQSLAHQCCRYNAVLCLQYLLTRVYYQTQMYIDFVNAQNFQGQTALHIAVQSGSIDCFYLLLKYGGVNLRLRNQTGGSPLSVANIFKRTTFSALLSNFEARGIRFLRLSHNEFSQDTYTRIYTEKAPQGKRRLKKQFDQIDLITQYDTDGSNQLKQLEKQQEEKMRKRLEEQEQRLKKNEQDLLKQQERKKIELQKKLQEQKKKAAEEMQILKKKAQEDMRKTQQQQERKKIQEQLKRKQLLAAEQLRLRQEQERKRAQEENQITRKKLLQEKQKRQQELMEERKKLEEQKKKRQKEAQEKKQKQEQEKMKRLKKEQEQQRKKKQSQNLSIIEQQRKMLEKEMEQQRKRLALRENNQQNKQITIDPSKNIHGVCPNQFLNLYNSIKDNFVDKSFPPQLSTIGQNVPKNLQDCVWLRPNEIFKDYAIFQEINFQDIKQGALGVCYYLATLSSLAQTPQRITSIFTFYDIKKGFYVLKFYEAGRQVYIVVDDYFPCYKRSKRPLFTNTISKQIWVMILQKAWVKQFGNYLKAEAMSPCKMMENLTGAPSKGYWIKDKTAAQIFDQLLEYDKDDNILVLTSKSKDPPEGIVGCHAYSLISVVPYQGKKFYKIRNPWGSFQWKGVYSDASNKWTEQLKKALDHKLDQNDGTFIMTDTQLGLGFEYVSIGMVKKGYVQGSPIEIHSASGQNLFYTFQLPQPATINLRVCQPFDRFLNDKKYKYSPVVFELVGINEKRFIAEGENYTHWGNKTINITDQGFVKLNSGGYLVRVNFSWQDQKKYNKANLCSYGQVPISFLKINDNMGWNLWEQGVVNTYSSKANNAGYAFQWTKGQGIIVVKKGFGGIKFTFNPSLLKNCRLGYRKTSNSQLAIGQNQVGTVDKIVTAQGTSVGSFTYTKF